MNIEIKNRWDGKVILCGEYKNIKDCLEKNRGADLSGADLCGADLEGAKSYYNSHDFWAELIRRKRVETFTDAEWSIIGVIIIHRICWDTIKKRFGQKVMPIFKKLSKIGFDEFEKKYAEVLKES